MVEEPVGFIEEHRAIDEHSDNDMISQDSEDGEELCEPKFKYRRILNDVSKMFAQDAASCMAVHERYIAVGTQWGRLYVLDHQGNQARDYQKKDAPPVCFIAHQVAVNAICIDRTGEYLVSCSNDGKVCIFALANSDQTQVISMDRPVRSVAVDYNFAKNQVLMTGDRVLVIHERGYFNKLKQTVVYSGKDRDGFIHHMSCAYSYLAFANDTGVRLYDRGLKQLITHVKREHSASLRSELYPCHITWLDNSLFAVAWADTLTICAIRNNPAHLVTASPELPGKLVEIRHLWNLGGYYAAGISFTQECSDSGSLHSSLQSINTQSSVQHKSNASKQWNEIVLFCVCARTADGNNENTESRSEEKVENGKTEGADGEGEDRPFCPRVWLLQPVNFGEFEKISEDIIEMRDCETLMCHNYEMHGLPDENSYFLLANRDMIEVRPSSSDDHLEWLLSNELFERALQFAMENAQDLTQHTVVDVGRQYLDTLIDCEHYEQAAQLCPQICGRHKDLWENYLNEFDRCQQLSVLAPYLPTQQPQLEPECYEMLLKELLSKRNVVEFRALVKQWSPDLYRVAEIITKLLDFLHKKKFEPCDYDGLMLTLAQLYTYERKYERALEIYMNLRDKAVFQHIDRYRLFHLVKERIRLLMDIDTEVAVRLLLENEVIDRKNSVSLFKDSLPAATVIKQLTKTPKLQLAYLEKLFNRNEGTDFADLAVTLYANHDAKKLLPYLRRSEHYNLDNALAICKQHGLKQERVFLLGRSGNRVDALNEIVHQLRDIVQAIDFCCEHNDHDLWMQLIRYAVQQTDTLRTLLMHIGTHVDPVLIIRQVPSGMRVEGLRDLLVHVLHNYMQQMQLQEGCVRVTLADCHNLLVQLTQTRQRAVRVQGNHKCMLCHKQLIQVPLMSSGNEFGYFTCGHMYHSVCLHRITTVTCPKCAPKL